MLTGILVVSCVLMAVLFTVLASWLQDLALHRSARANLTAAACCAVSAAVVPFGGQALPATIEGGAPMLLTGQAAAARTAQETARFASC